MKIIDLLNKIANGEEVPKFWWNGCIHQIEKDYNGNCSIFDTYCKKYKRVELNQLNDEVKIIEEDKKIEIPKHIPNEVIQDLDREICPANVKCIAHKVNEIINYLQHINRGD